MMSDLFTGDVFEPREKRACGQMQTTETVDPQLEIDDTQGDVPVSLQKDLRLIRDNIRRCGGFWPPI
jgi:hypothetical protein